MADRYSFSLTTFSPSGKLVQIEYALNAVNQGSLSIGVKVNGGAVLLTEKKTTSPLIDDKELEKVAPICDSIGMLYSGMGPDARLLLLRARKIAQTYKRTYGQEPTVGMLVRELAGVVQEFTQSGGVRPFGVSLLVVGFEDDKLQPGKRIPALYQVDPSGTYWAWKATAIGRGYVNATSFLEKRYSKDLELEDAIHTALQTMRQSFDGRMTPSNIQIGVADANKGTFHLLSETEVQEHLLYSQ